MVETDEYIPHSEADREVSITQEGHPEDKEIIEIKETADKKGSGVNPVNQPEDLELYQHLQTEIKINV